MIRNCAIAVLIFGSLSQSAGAQSPEPSKSPIRLLPNYVATDQPKDVPRRTEPRPGPVPPPLPMPRATMQPWEHLIIAADHLEAAGHQNEADELRERARRQKNAEQLSTEELRRELKRLKAELDALQNQLTPPQQIEIRLKVIEFSEERLRQAGVELPASLQTPLPRSGIVEDPASLLREIEDLEKQGLVKVLARPLMRTTSGRPASIMSGGEFPIPVPQGPKEKRIEWRPFGVRVQAVPSIVSDRKLRLEVQAEFSERDFNSVVTVDGKEIPGLTTRRLNTQVVLNAGEMLVLSNLRSTRSLTQADGSQQSESRDLMILLSADVVKSAGSSENPAPPPARN